MKSEFNANKLNSVLRDKLLSVPFSGERRNRNMVVVVVVKIKSIEFIILKHKQNLKFSFPYKRKKWEIYFASEVKH